MLLRLPCRARLPLRQVLPERYGAVVSSALTASRLLSTPAAREAFLSYGESSEQGIAFLNLNRPRAKNALSLELLADMHLALQQIRTDGVTRVLILQSTTPSIFCAGADLKQRLMMTPPQIHQFLHSLRKMISELEGLEIPTIAALDGPALGGGLELALGCDFRVAGAGATKIGLPETRLAIVPGAGGTQRLARLLGPSKAKELIFTSRLMTAAEAYDVGIVNCLAGEGQTATERAIILAQEMLPSGPLAIKMAKLAIQTGSRLDLEAGLDLEAQCYATLFPTQDRLEGLKAFAEKRKPVYRGE